MKQSKISFDCKINMIFDFVKTKSTVAFYISNIKLINFIKKY